MKNDDEGCIPPITFSLNYVNNLSRGLTFDGAMIELEKYSKRNYLDFDAAVYYFVLKLLSTDLFFSKQMKESEVRELLYVAIHFASYTSYKAVTRKNKARLVSVNTREKNLYTLLQTKIISSIYSNFDGFARTEVMETYLALFFELNCVQRKRKSTTKKVK